MTTFRHFRNVEGTSAEICLSVGHFTVVGLVSWPLNEREAEVDLVLTQTSFLGMNVYSFVSR